MKTIFLTLFLLLSHSSYSAISKTELDSIFKTFHEVYNPLINSNEMILFNSPMVGDLQWWDIDVFRAAYHGDENESTGEFSHYIWVFGGLAKKPYMTVDGVALIICHELGHGFGGPPYKDNGVTTEGQSDYYSTEYCLQEFMDRYTQQIHTDHLPEEIKSACNNDSICLRAFVAVETRIEAFRQNEGIETSLTAQDETIVDEMNTSDTFYPSHQCRIDTHKASILKLPRPKCWYKD